MKKTIEELQETHSEMLATASDLGLAVPEELKSQITDQGAGATIVRNLDALIREHQKKSLAPEDEAVQGAGVATSPEPVAPKAKPKRAAAKKAPPKKAAETPPPQPKETPVAKKAAKKTAKKAKSPKATGGARVSFADEAKITWTGKDNPAREGSGKHDRIEGVRKASGKTVKTFRAGRGKTGTLGWCVKNGLAKVA